MIAFQKPNSFLFVSEISLSDTPLQDFDIVSVHHLPRLSVLWLNNTGIGSEAFVMIIFLRLFYPIKFASDLGSATWSAYESR